MHLLHVFVFILTARSSAVKIGVSKFDSTTSTTPATTTTTAMSSTNMAKSSSDDVPTTSPPDFEGATEEPSPSTDDVSKDYPEFPPSIFKKTTKKQKTLTTTTTAMPKTTTEVTTTPIPPEIMELNNTIQELQANFLKFYCYCNLLADTCDINCCCDPDCSKEALKVFDCYAESQHTELRNRLEDFQYQHGLPSCKINDGWLCVFRTNIHPEKEKLFKGDYSTDRHYKWPSSALQFVDAMPIKKAEFYKYGDPLRVYNENSLDFENFDMPYDYKPPHCQAREPVKHLLSLRRACLYLDEKDHAKAIAEFLKATLRLKLLGQPNEDFSNGQPDSSLIDIHVKKCLEKSAGSQECISVESEEGNNTIDSGAVRGITLKILHNYTNVLGAAVEVRVPESPDGSLPPEMWLEYEVKFLHTDRSLDSGLDIDEELSASEKLLQQKQRQYSGPLGYLQGEPVIMSKFVAKNQSQEISEGNRILGYFHETNFYNDTIHLFARSKGMCRKTYEKEHAINFGINVMTQCTARLDRSEYREALEKRKEKSYNTICTKIQASISHQLLDFLNDSNDFQELSAIFISSLGHPENSSDKWLPLQVKNFEASSITAQLDEDTKIFTCHNILLSAAYEFHIATHAVDGVEHQSVIKNAALKLGQRHDIVFSLDEEFEVPVFVTVRFYDSTSDAINGGCARSPRYHWSSLAFIALVFLPWNIVVFLE